MPKTLIVGPAWIGDMVMTQSLCKVIKQAQPSTEITVLAPSWSMPILARMPEVSDTLCMPLQHGQLGLRVRYSLGRRLRQNGFTHAIVLPNSLKSAVVPWVAKIPTRTGYLGEQRWGLLNDVRSLDKHVLPMNVQRFVALGIPKAAADSGVSSLNIPLPQLTVERSQVRTTAARFGLDSDTPMIALCPGAEYGPAKQWPAEHFAEVANTKIQSGYQVWLFGSTKDCRIAARINQLCQQRCVDLSGRTTLDEAIDFLSLANSVVTNDSGLMHIAAAVGCHVVAIYGSSSERFTPPLSARADCLNLHLPCSPCFARTCPLGHLDCLKKLSAKTVLETLQ